MGLDVGVIANIDYSFNIPYDAREFALFLMVDSSQVAAHGEGQALGFWTKDEMAADFRIYLDEKEPETIEEQTIIDWLASLPWDDDNYIRLYFNS